MLEKVRKWRATRPATIFLINLLISITSGATNNMIALLNSLAEIDAEPTNLFIKSCWPINVNTAILREATMQVVFIDDFLYKLPIDLSPNHVMFVTNLDCDWSEDFVNGVRILIFMRMRSLKFGAIDLVIKVANSTCELTHNIYILD